MNDVALAPAGRVSIKRRIFGSNEFFRLWIAQVVSATGDWLGFLAIVITAARVGSSPEAAVGLVATARILPGFFLAPIAGVLADRLSRKRVMVVCDVGRAATVAWLPFVDTVWQLVVASLLLEALTLTWSPAKEATVPNLVPRDHLTTANSLSLAAAYGTFPLAAGLFIGLARASDALSDVSALSAFRIDQESLAFYVDVVTFLVAAFIVWRLPLRTRPRSVRVAAARERGFDFGQTFRELKEGWSYIFINPTVRAVNLAIATGLIGGGMLVPLGPVFSIDVLGSGTAGFGAFVTALGVGVGAGVVTLSLMQRRINKRAMFVAAVFGAGASLLVAASMWTLAAAAAFVALIGVCAGGVYVLGFTLLQETVSDELRGRIFGALFTIVRLAVLIAFAVGPFLAAALDGLSSALVDKHIDIGSWEVFVPGVRLTLWLAGLIIIAAGFVAMTALREQDR